MRRNTLISVVDDDESVRDSTRALLRSVGYQVRTFESSELFLQSGALQETGCLILDMLILPGMDGLELQSQLRISDVGLPIIFVTAQQDKDKRQLAMDGGAADFFQKPFVPADLLTAIGAAMDRSPVWSEGPPEGVRIGPPPR